MPPPTINVLKGEPKPQKSYRDVKHTKQQSGDDNKIGRKWDYALTFNVQHPPFRPLSV